MADQEPEKSQGDHSVTLYDVARLAGVAPSTVSRTFSRPGRVSERTAAKVRAAAEQLGYRANTVTSPRPGSRTNLLTVVTADIGNPMILEIVQGMQDVAGQAGYQMAILDSYESDVLESAAIEKIMPLTDGLVLSSSRLSDLTIRQIAKQKPMVVLNREVRDVACALPDYARGIRRAMEHLGELGHEQICYLGGPETSWANGARWRAVREAGDELVLGVRRTGPHEPTVRGGVEAAHVWAKRPATGVIAFNDMMALGFLRGARDLGFEVPGDVSVIGFDNVEAAEIVTPRLTTIATARRLEGQAAAKSLLLQARRDYTPRAPMTVPAQLVERESTGPAPGEDPLRRSQPRPGRPVRPVSRRRAGRSGRTRTRPPH